MGERSHLWFSYAFHHESSNQTGYILSKAAVLFWKHAATRISVLPITTEPAVIAVCRWALQLLLIIYLRWLQLLLDGIRIKDDLFPISSAEIGTSYVEALCWSTLSYKYQWQAAIVVRITKVIPDYISWEVSLHLIGLWGGKTLSYLLMAAMPQRWSDLAVAIASYQKRYRSCSYKSEMIASLADGYFYGAHLKQLAPS